jgi:formiminoglutamase
MSLASIKAQLAKTNPVPIVSADPRDRPLGKWLASEHRFPDTVLIGIPFDGATVVPGRKGAAGGPAAVRESLGELNCYSIPLDIDISEHLTGADIGDIPIAGDASVTSVHDLVSELLQSLIGEGILPVTMGGDDSLCFAAARALCRAAKAKVGVIGFDAHLDMRVLYNPESSSGSSYRRLFDEFDGQIRPANTVHIGGNGWFAAKEYADYARDKGVTLVTCDEVYERGIDVVVSEAIAKASKGTEAIYVNFDMDVLDQHYAPGKVMRNPGGMRGRDAYRAARLLGEHPKVKLFALSEVNSKRDLSNFTALVGASIIGYFWAGMAFRKRKEAKPARGGRTKASKRAVKTRR